MLKVPGAVARRDKLPYQVICTHSHYDHIGSNYQFPEGICFGGADAAFTQSNQGQRKPYKDGTWGDAVQQFTIKTWLQVQIWLNCDASHGQRRAFVES